MGFKNTFITTALLLSLTTSVAHGQNETMSFDELIASAQNGDPNAQYSLGTAYLNGQGVLQDFEKAYSAFKGAADAGHIGAMTDLAALKAQGLGTEKSLTDAYNLYLHAGNKNYAPAQHILASMIEKGLGTSEPKANAKTWYERAAQSGFAESQVSLGYLFHSGEIIPQDFTQALYWYEKAAAQENVRALNNLGLIYTRGEGVAQDYKKAVGYFEKAAEMGSQQGYRNLAVMYENGFGVPQSDAISVELYKQATAEKRETRRGKDLPTDADIKSFINQPDFDMASTKKAAQSGNADYQYLLGYLYLKGWKVPQDFVLAHKWLNLSATQTGETVIADMRSSLEERMTISQKNQAQDMARNWMANQGN